ncbi:hypothetical protein BDM02DRAFT_1703812 [Thelephora ganbajun]|uniref:Uncharacterized protein n=1 Tax=Thelephora ganbajun TaxID=370292 RepID=A0ACB6ZJU5_THEGA|nr:hypothetical protein BDM02DRAFT_1703812 [Thelephora ganbajun]
MAEDGMAVDQDGYYQSRRYKTTPTAINRPSWFARTTRNKYWRLSPLRRRIPFLSDSESTQSFTRGSDNVEDAILPLSASRCIDIVQTQEANRTRIRSYMSSFRVSAPSPLNATPSLVRCTNPGNPFGLSVPLSATQRILPLLPQLHHFHMQAYTGPQSQPLGGLPVHFLRFVLCPTPPSIFISTRIRANIEPNAS